MHFCVTEALLAPPGGTAGSSCQQWRTIEARRFHVLEKANGSRDMACNAQLQGVICIKEHVIYHSDHFQRMKRGENSYFFQSTVTSIFALYNMAFSNRDADGGS